MTDHSVEQAIRRLHCSHKDCDDAQHQCVGSCHITPQGVALDCKACGKDDWPIAPLDTLLETRLVREVLDALGISYDVLSPEYKARAASAAKRWLESRRYG